MKMGFIFSKLPATESTTTMEIPTVIVESANEKVYSEIDCGASPSEKRRLIKFFDDKGFAPSNNTGFRMKLFPQYIKGNDGFFDPRRYDINGIGHIIYHCLDGDIEYRNGKFWGTPRV